MALLSKTTLLLLLFTASLRAWAQPNPGRADITKAFAAYPQSPRRDLVAKVFDCDENKKLHAFTLLLTPDGYIQFGSNPRVNGRAGIEKMLIAFNQRFKHLQQHILEVFKDTEKEIVYSAEATYSFDDGTVLPPIPYMVHLRFAGGLVSEYKIYIDLAPVYQHLQQVKK